MKRHKIIYFGMALIAVAIILVGVISFRINQSVSQEKVDLNKEEVKNKVTLVIDGGDGLLQTFLSEYQAGMTAFDLLKKETDGLKLPLKTKTYDVGIFIEAIGNKENGENEKYWMYYINGVLPMVAADKQEIKVDDKVEFKFEKSSF